jgi:hypothetical protein
MEALKRKPNLEVSKETLTLPDGVVITKKGITARELMRIANDKRLSDKEVGIHLTVAKILVDGKPIVYDDLLDGFTDEELTQIVEFIKGTEEGSAKNV